MKNSLLLTTLLLMLFISCKTQKVLHPAVETAMLSEIIDTLTCDSLQGRLAGSGYDLKSAKFIENRLTQMGYVPLFDNSGIVDFEIPASASRIYRRFGDSITNKSYNVVMIRRTSNPNGGNLLIGAHHDHMGVLKADEKSRGFTKGDIFRGANDNASGIASLLEIARIQSENHNHKHNLIVAAFGAEELGLIGSKALCNRLISEGIDIEFMINIEMTGTLSGGSVEFLGNDSFNTDSVFMKVANPASLDFVKSNAKSKGSDQIPFFDASIPVAVFATMGIEFYHDPRDDKRTINFEGMTTLTTYINNFAELLLTSNSLPKFTAPTN